MVRLTDRPDKTLDVYRGRKTTLQQQPLSRTYFHGSIDVRVIEVLLYNELKIMLLGTWNAYARQAG